MIINELILSSFGKFKGKSIKLEKGFNIVFGENEAGKTTVHKFIEGMLFGFFKPYIKRRIYTEDYEKYLPWDYTDYSGVLKYTVDENVYRIERNFLKGSDEVKIIDDKTGEDISHLFEYDNITRLYQPMSSNMGLNSIVFNNTISIGQLKNKTEDILAKEVKDSLINLGGSLDEDISVKKVIEKLNEKMNDIGTEKRIKTSPYGRIVEEIEKLHDDKRKAMKIAAEVKEYQEKANIISEKIKVLIKDRAEIESKINLLEIVKAKEKYNECVKLSEEINSLNKQIEELKEYSSLNNDDYTEAIKLEYELKSLEDEKEKLKERQIEILTSKKKNKELLKQMSYFETVESEEIDNLIVHYKIMEQKKQELDNIYKKLSNKAGNKIDIKNIDEKLFKYEELEDKRNTLQLNNEYSNIIFLKTRLDEKSKNLKEFNLLRIVSILGIIAGLAVGLFVSEWLFTVLAIPIILLGYLEFSSRELKKYINELNSQIEEIDKREKEKQLEIAELESAMQNILQECNCKTKMELRKLANDIAQRNFAANEVIELKNKKNSLIEDIQKIEDKIKAYINFINEDMVTMDNIKKLKDRYYRYLDIKKQENEIENTESELLSEFSKIEDRKSELDSKLKTIFKKNNVDSNDAFKEGLDKKKNYERLIQLLDSKKSLINNILGDNNIDYLKRKFKDFTDIIEQDIKDLDQEKLITEMKEKDDIINDAKNELTRLEEKIRILSASTSELVQIEEEIIRKTSIKEEYEKKLKSLEIAKKAIEEISKNIQRDFAPRLNNGVGKIIDKVTNNKYKEVKITENLDIKIVEPNNKKLVAIDRLSGGTIDQLYFAMRLEIINIIKRDNILPLILDDCFVQYDYERLEKILEFLGKESQKRQIILFTCHKREREILSKNNVKFNLVKL